MMIRIELQEQQAFLFFQINTGILYNSSSDFLEIGKSDV